MQKISSLTKLSLPKIKHKKKMEILQKIKEREAILQKIKEQNFDTFVKNTAREMLKDSFKYNLKIFNTKNLDI